MGCIRSPYAHTSTPANARGCAAATATSAKHASAPTWNALSVRTHSPALPSAYPESLGPGSAAPAPRIAATEGFCRHRRHATAASPASAPATALRTHASSCSRSQTKTPWPVPTSTEEACASASMPCSARAMAAGPRPGSAPNCTATSALPTKIPLGRRDGSSWNDTSCVSNTVAGTPTPAASKGAVRMPCPRVPRRGGTRAVPAGVQQEEHWRSTRSRREPAGEASRAGSASAPTRGPGGRR